MQELRQLMNALQDRGIEVTKISNTCTKGACVNYSKWLFQDQMLCNVCFKTEGEKALDENSNKTTA